MLKIQMLGSFQVTQAGAHIPGLSKSRLQSVLAYLLLHRHAPQSREYLAYTLWPDSSESQARTNLRRELHQLRRTLPDADHCLLNIDSHSIQWVSGEGFSFDVAEFEDALVQADLHRTAQTQGDFLQNAIGLYQGDLAPALYEDWILPKREELRQKYVQALKQLIALLVVERDYTPAIQFSQRLLRYDPLHEAGYRQMMELYTQQRDRASALHTYHTLTVALERELGVPPSAETRALYERLLKADAAPELAPTSLLLDAARLVGRHSEWQSILTAWRKSSKGQAHCVLITGEAGIGKTRLAEELLDWVNRQGIASARTRSYAAEGSLAYAPIIDWLRSPAVRTGLTSLEDIWLTEVARLLPELRAEFKHLPSPQPLTDRLQRQHLFEALARAFLVDQQPKLLLIDDLQWCDLETLEWLHYLLRFDSEASLLLLGTARSEDLPREHPLHALEQALRDQEQVTTLELTPLTAKDTTALAQQISGRVLNAAAAAHLFAESEGNPLFVVEMVRVGYHESDVAAKAWQSEQHLPNSDVHLPPRVRTLIQSRLAQLSPLAHRLAGLAATIGRSFTLDVLLAASTDEDSAVLQAMDELWRRRIIREQGAQRYDFSHDRIRDTVYAEISPLLHHLFHRQVAEALEATHGDNLDAISGELAAHYARATLAARAIPFYQRAAAEARRTLANENAVDYLTQAIQLLHTLPETMARQRQELGLQIELSAALQAARSMTASEVEAAYQRAETLARELGDATQLFPARFGWWIFQFSISDQRSALVIGKELLESAQHWDNPDFTLQAHHALWTSFFACGDFRAALGHYEQGRAIYRPKMHHAQLYAYGAHDAGICGMSYGGLTQWLLGYLDQAQETSRAALALGAQFTHPASLAQSLYLSAVLNQLQGDAPAVRLQAEAANRVRSQHVIPFWAGWDTCLLGWADSLQGHPASGIAQIQRGLNEMLARRGRLLHSYFVTLLAEAYWQSGQITLGLQALDSALAEAEQTGEQWWTAEMHRRRGDLLRQQGDADAAEQSYLRGLEIAGQQHAKTLELRAAVALCALWQSRGRAAQAHWLLSEHCAWFREGLDTPDLRAAKALLQTLG